MLLIRSRVLRVLGAQVCAAGGCERASNGAQSVNENAGANAPRVLRAVGGRTAARRGSAERGALMPASTDYPELPPALLAGSLTVSGCLRLPGCAATGRDGHQRVARGPRVCQSLLRSRATRHQGNPRRPARGGSVRIGRAPTAPHLLLPSGDEGCAGTGHPRTRGTRRPLDDTTLHGPQSGRDRGRDSAAR